MLKSYPGWVPYHQTTRLMKPKRPVDELDFFGLTLSRQQLFGAVRSVLITAIPMVLYFSGVTWAVSLLAPFAPLMGLSVGGMFQTTGGIMLLSYSFLASLSMLIPALAALIPMAAGQPWIGAAVGVTVSWVAVFVWTYLDPPRRQIAVPRLFAIFLLMLGMAITTEKAGWTIFRTTFVFMCLLTGAGVLTIFFSEALCIIMTKELGVGLYNLGIMLDASTQPIQAHAMEESAPHFHLDYPAPNISKIRANHQKQLENVYILMRENMFESIFAPAESARNSKLLTTYIVVADVIVSAVASALRGLAHILVASEWKHLNTAIDDYIGVTRSIFDECIRCLNSMYSGNGYLGDFDDLLKQHNEALQKIMDGYTHQVKMDKSGLADRDNSAAISFDHWIYQLSQLNKAILSFIAAVKEATEQSSQLGYGWFFAYYIRAFIMTFVILIINAVYLIRSLIGMVLQPFRSIGRKCCCVRRSEEPDVELGSVASATPPQPPTGLAKLLAATNPPKIHMDDYIAEGRWKFMVRFVIVATAISAAALCVHLYWIPKVNTPFWMITSCLIVMSPTLGSTWRRTLQRACGTFIGALLGQIVVIVCISTHRYVAFGPLILATLFCAYMMNSEKAKYNYFYSIFILSFGIVVITDYPFVTGASWKLGSYRFLFVFIGALIGTLSSFILPEYSYDIYIGIARKVLLGSRSAIKLIHSSLANKTAVDMPKLQEVLGGLHMLQAAAVANRDDAEAEVFHRPQWKQSIRFLRYKLRDVLFATRLQALSAATGFGSSNVADISSHFIKHAEKVIQNIDLEVEYVDTRLKDHDAQAIMPLTTDQVRADFQALEADIAALMKDMTPEMMVMVNSHLTLFRLFCVCVHDLARGSDHYYGTF